MILGLIAAGNIEVVITGDKNFIDIQEYGGARMPSPRGFWDLVKKQG
jgi:predicted nucleic acid-binding protein